MKNSAIEVGLRRVYLGLAAPLMPLVFKTAGLFNAKMQAGLEMRKKNKIGQASWLKGSSGSQPIWIHCASGEFEYAKPVIRLLKEHHADIPILVTYFSPSAKKAVENFKGVDIAVPFPWENAKIWREFLDFYEPRVLLIARTDVWPEMLYQTSQKNIQSLLFSATLVAGSGRLKFPARWFTKLSLQNLTQIYCVSESDAHLFAQLGFSEKTRVAGDTRFDQVIARLAAAQAKSQNSNSGNIFDRLSSASDLRPVFVAGSTWSEDETELLVAISQLKGKVKFVLVPHEPKASHLNELEKKLNATRISFSRLSNLNQTSDVVIIDQVGVLAELYLGAQFALVGGSFRKSVHSVMEPLAAGCFTFVGPHHLNNREAIEFQKLELTAPLTSPGSQSLARNLKLAPVQMVANGQELVEKIELILNLETRVQLDYRSQIKDAVSKRAGRSELVVKWVQSALQGIV